MDFVRRKTMRSVKPAGRRPATVAAVFAAACAMALVTAAPASAEVKATCGQYICVATAHQGRDFIQDITVTTRDGLPGTLRAFVGDYNNRKTNVSQARFVINREFRAYPRLAVCGGLDRGGRVIENHCVLLP